MNFDKVFVLVASLLLIGTSVARTLKNAHDKTINGKLGIAMSLSVSIIAGIMLGLLISIYTDDPKWQMLATSIGAWSGEKSLDFITNYIHEKFNIKPKDDEN